MNKLLDLDADYLVTKQGNKIPLDDGISHTVYLDLNGASLTQSVLDIITSEANQASDSVNIILRRVGMACGGVPRLIADRGEIYDALTKLLKERQ